MQSLSAFASLTTGGKLLMKRMFVDIVDMCGERRKMRRTVGVLRLSARMRLAYGIET
jgi:hypothetical protein